MSERSSVTQVVQIGAEATPGTTAPANRRLQSISIAPAMAADIAMFRPPGNKYATVQALNKEWATAAITGQPTYDELVFMLSSVLSTATITTPGGATDARLWTFEPSSEAEDDPVSFTVEQGSSVRAHRASYGLVNDLALNVTRSEVGLTGAMLMRQITDDITLTASPDTLPLVPILPGDWSIYLDDVGADLGDTKLTRNYSFGFNLAGRFTPQWTVDAANGSWVAPVEAAPTAQFTLKQQANSEGMGILSSMREGDTKFLRAEAIGREIETGHDYRVTLELAGKVSAVGTFGDEQEVFAVDWTFDIVHDDTWGHAIRAEVVNASTGLGDGS